MEAEGKICVPAKCPDHSTYYNEDGDEIADRCSDCPLSRLDWIGQGQFSQLLSRASELNWRRDKGYFRPEKIPADEYVALRILIELNDAKQRNHADHNGGSGSGQFGAPEDDQ